MSAIPRPLQFERYGESVQAVPLTESDREFVSYAVEAFGFDCRFSLAIDRNAAALLIVDVRVGRFYRGYRRALRWMANNRACNTVAIAFGDHDAKNAEVCLACTRVTTATDPEGLRATLNDIHFELGVVDAALRMWFPQVLRGQRLTELEGAAVGDDGIRSMLASPQPFLDLAQQQSDEDADSELIAEAYGWLNQWDGLLRHIDRAESGPETDRKDFLWLRARPLMELRRWKEVIAVCQELDVIADEADKPMAAGGLAHALYEMGEYEEVLDVLRSATLDNCPRVCLYRALAQAKLGHGCEATEAYLEYDRLIGWDIFATKMLTEATTETDVV